MSANEALQIDTSDFKASDYIAFLNGFKASETTRVKYLITRTANLLRELENLDLVARTETLLKIVEHPESQKVSEKLRAQINRNIAALLKISASSINEPEPIAEADKPMESIENTPQLSWGEQINLQMNTAVIALRHDIEKREEGQDISITGIEKKGKILKLDIKLDSIDMCPATIQRDTLLEQLPLGTQLKLITKCEDLDSDEVHAGIRYKYLSPTRSAEWEEEKREYKSSTVAATIKNIEIVGDENDGTLRLHLILNEKGAVHTEYPSLARLKIPDLTKVLKRYLKVLEDDRRGESDIRPPQEAFMTGNFATPETDLKSIPTLDESQNQAYGRAMSDEPVLFVQGPPGSGKTTTICSIIEEQVKRGRKVLVLSDSNKGVDVPAVMLKKKGVPIFRAGNNPKMIDERVHRERIIRGVKFPAKELEKIRDYKPDREEKRDRDSHRRSFGSFGSFDHFDSRPATPHLRSNKDVKDEMRDTIMQGYRAKRAEAYRKMEDKLLRGGVVFSTFGTIINDENLESIDFDVVIIDEATKARMPQVLHALKRATNQVIFVGDPKQLGNINLTPAEKLELKGKVKETMASNGMRNYSEPAREREYQPYETAYWAKERDVTRDIIRRRIAQIYSPIDDPERYEEIAEQAVQMYENGPFTTAMEMNPDLPKVFLSKDRRSLPNIVKVLSELIYEGKLLPGREAKETEDEGIVTWIDTKSIETTERSAGTSKRNPKEADVVVDMVLDRLLDPDTEKRVDPKDIAVIATYAEQAESIKKKLTRKLHNNKDLLEKILKNVDSVDAFQGDERKIVFVSMTRSNKQGTVGFLEEEKRIGVAIGRAKDELYIVGDSSTLVDKNTSDDSQQFFSQLQKSVTTHGKVEQVEQKKQLPKHSRERARRRNAANRRRMAKRHEHKEEKTPPSTATPRRPAYEEAPRTFANSFHYRGFDGEES